ncbi:MAG: hypothetical protein AB7G34_08915 [Hyphomicrobiales bacterium]
MGKLFFTSITRISDLEASPFDVVSMPRARWGEGDYVAADVIGRPGPLYRIELPCGRRTQVQAGDRIIGAFGTRAATHECVGSWRDIGDDGRCHQLTGAGVIGRVTSNSSWVSAPMQLQYAGHVRRRDRNVKLADFVGTPPAAAFAMPVIVVAGSSMSAGKTLTMRAIVTLLKRMGLTVAAAKFTGAAGYKDALSYSDAGADHVLDYVDAGLVSTVCERAVYERALDIMLAKIAATGAGVLVAEIGASPLEPYNGDTAMERLKPHVRLLGLCAGDGYAAYGFCRATGHTPGFVTGQAANTSASAGLVRQLTGLQALDLRGDEGLSALHDLLRAAISREA